MAKQTTLLCRELRCSFFSMLRNYILFEHWQPSIKCAVSAYCKGSKHLNACISQEQLATEVNRKIRSKLILWKLSRDQLPYALSCLAHFRSPEA